jgi:cytidine deaminase
MPLSNQLIGEIQAARRAAGGCIPAALVARLAAEGMPLEQLMLDLIPVAQTHAIPPISKLDVGAVSLGKSGALYFGANYEFPGGALGFTVHGEQAAVAEAISFGESGIEMLAVSAAPCGYCRQFLYELTTASTLQILLPGAPAALLTSLLDDRSAAARPRCRRGRMKRPSSPQPPAFRPAPAYGVAWPGPGRRAPAGERARAR